MNKNAFRLRCYARPENDYILGVCIDLSIAVRGDSIKEVQSKMTDAIKSYLSSLDEENIIDLFPRPASLTAKAEYYAIHCLINSAKYIKKVRSNFFTFCELATPQSFKVTACV